jgi:CIC family chloride channel protein
MGLLTLALVVGAGAGGGAIVFRWLIQSFTIMFTGHVDYSGLGPVGNPHFPWLGRWFVLFTPIVAGLLYGPLVHFFAREARGHGVPEVMYAVRRNGGRIAPQVAGVKALASALCIGGGGSVGREGPIVQIGSALGSTLGRLLKVTEGRMKVLVACGAAGGIAATFNAPLAGVFFAMELILADFTAQAFGMVVIASVTASVIARSVLGDNPFLTLPPFTVNHLGQYFFFAVLGLLAGAVGVVFTRVLYWVEDACDWAWRWPEWLRPACGGILLGLVLLVLPELYGVGYPVLGNGVAGVYAVGFLVVLMLGKVLATSLTIGIGGSGGVFAPSLFIGAMLGSAFGQVLAAIDPSLAGPPGAYGLIGMGAVFAGASRAPITAVVIMFELTGEYSIILPLMAAIVLATAVSRLLSRDTIYTAKLRRRGIDLDAPLGLSVVPVSQVMEPLGDTLQEGSTIGAALRSLELSPVGQVVVVDSTGDYLGVVTSRTVADALAAGESELTSLDKVLEYATPVTAADMVELVISVLDASADPVPVLQGAKPVGWLGHRAALRAFHPLVEAQAEESDNVVPPHAVIVAEQEETAG